MLGRMRSIALTASARVINRDPIDIFERRQHFGAQLGIEDRPARSLVDETIRRDGDDQHVAEFARGLQMADMAEMQEIKGAVRLNDGLAGGAQLLARSAAISSSVRTLSRGLIAAVDARLAAQLCDA